MHFLSILTLIPLLPLISAHGILITPPSRAPGPASLSSCGKTITNIIKADNQTSIGSLQVASVSAKDYDSAKCNLNLCKGLQLADNEKNVQKWKPGEVVTLKVWTRIPHIGWASVAIVDSKTLLLVGGTLASWETGSVSGYEEMIHGDHGNEDLGTEMQVDMEVNVTIPKLFPRCAVAGECVLQWTWFGRVVKQTYESCVDFVVDSEPFLKSYEEQKGIWEQFGETFDG